MSRAEWGRRQRERFVRIPSWKKATAGKPDVTLIKTLHIYLCPLSILAHGERRNPHPAMLGTLRWISAGAVLYYRSQPSDNPGVSPPHSQGTGCRIHLLRVEYRGESGPFRTTIRHKQFTDSGPQRGGDSGQLADSFGRPSCNYSVRAKSSELHSRKKGAGGGFAFAYIWTRFLHLDSGEPSKVDACELSSRTYVRTTSHHEHEKGSYPTCVHPQS
jgi:hypothetical protein